MTRTIKKLSLTLLAAVGFVGGAFAADQNPCENSCPSGQSRYLGRGGFEEYIYMMGNPGFRHPMAWQTDDFFADVRVAALGGGQSFSEDEFASFLTFKEKDCQFTVGNFSTGNGDIGRENLLPKGLGEEVVLVSGAAPQKLSFCPLELSKVIIDFDIYLGLNNIFDGLFLDVRVPVEWQKSRACLKSCDGEAKDIIDAFKGDAQTVTTEWETPITLPIEQWKYGRIACAGDCDSDWGVNDIVLDLGWDVVREENGYFGARARVVFPAGSKPDESLTFLFGPRVGLNRWGLGGAVAGGLTVWERDGGDKAVTVHADLNAIHLFKRDELITFDLLGKGAGSRFLLLKEFDASGAFSKLVPGVNVLTVCADSKFNWQVEGTLMGDISWSNWNTLFGYNVFGRSEEKIEICNKDTIIKPNTYGIAGTTTLNDNTTASGSTISLASAADASATFLSGDNLDLVNTQMPRFIQHTIFAGLTHTFADHDYPFYCGVNGAISWGNDNKALNEWKLFINFGGSYS